MKMSFFYRLGYKLGRKFRFFIQRCKRGFDDSETWDLQDTFYRWLLPRLKRFYEVTRGYPTNYKTFKQWKNELKSRVKQLEKIVKINDMDFTDYKYIPKEKLRSMKAIGTPKSTLNMWAKDYCVEDFNNWFREKLSNLWW